MDIQQMVSRYNAAKAKKVGEVFACGFCGKEKKKKQHQQAFCCIGHKDRYHNTVNESRKARARFYNGTERQFQGSSEGWLGYGGVEEFFGCLNEDDFDNL